MQDYIAHYSVVCNSRSLLTKNIFLEEYKVTSNNKKENSLIKLPVSQGHL